MPTGSGRRNDHLIRRSRRTVQDRPSLAMCWVDVLDLSTRVSCCPAAWQQYWQQPDQSWADTSYRAPHATLFVAAHRVWHLGALVLVTTAGPSAGDATVHCPAQTPPPNPIAAVPGDGRVLSNLSSRVHQPCIL